MKRPIKMRSRAPRYQACERKVNKYATAREAQEALDRFLSMNPWSLEKIVYRCPYGDHFHYGAPLNRQKR